MVGVTIRFVLEVCHSVIMGNVVVKGLGNAVCH